MRTCPGIRDAKEVIEYDLAYSSWFYHVLHLKRLISFSLQEEQIWQMLFQKGNPVALYASHKD